MNIDDLYNEDEKAFQRRQARYGASLQNAFGQEVNRQALQNTQPPPTEWVVRVTWTEFFGKRHEVVVLGHRTLREAQDAARGVAISAGWTPPKGWQWWRIGDTPNF